MWPVFVLVVVMDLCWLWSWKRVSSVLERRLAPKRRSLSGAATDPDGTFRADICGQSAPRYLLQANGTVDSRWPPHHLLAHLDMQRFPMVGCAGTARGRASPEFLTPGPRNRALPIEDTAKATIHVGKATAITVPQPEGAPVRVPTFPNIYSTQCAHTRNTAVRKRKLSGLGMIGAVAIGACSELCAFSHSLNAPDLSTRRRGVPYPTEV